MPTRTCVDVQPHQLDGLFSSMEKASYLERRRYIRFKISGGKPRRFHYKFRSLQLTNCGTNACSKYTERSIANLRDLIVDSSFRLSRPSDFNDPFDMQAFPYISGTLAERRTKFLSLAASQGVPPSEHQAFAAQWMTKPDYELLEGFKKAFDRMRNETGVFSFAGDPRSILMWSHYAADNAGICLQFEAARDFRVLSRAVTAQYVRDFPRLNWITTDFQKAIGEVLFRKHPNWEYESETRLMFPGDAGKYLRVAPVSLRGLI